MTAADRHHRRVGGGLAVVGACALALALAACGGSGGNSPGVASVGGSHHSAKTTSPPAGGGASSFPGAGSGSGHAQIHAEMKPIGADAAQELRYAQCMRANGEPNFPDPNGQGVFSFGSAQGIDPQSPQYQAAQKRCAHDLPHPSFTPAQRQQQYDNLLRYSECMRSHGVPSYPDPTRGSDGSVGLTIKGGPNSGIDPASPIFQRAQQTCGKLQGAPPGLGGK